MAWIRQLKSGLWAGTIYTRPGDPTSRVTYTDEHKESLKVTCAEEERKVRRGEYIHPREGEITIAEMWEQAKGSRHLELDSRRRNESHWRVHVQPRWGTRQVSSVRYSEVSTWVVDMQQGKIGAATIEGAVGVLRLILDAAVADNRIAHNPARGVKTPRRNAHLDRVLSPTEDHDLMQSLDRQFPERPAARLFCELLRYCGLRWEEAAAIDRPHVDMHKRLIHIGPVVERDGTIRPYPKSPAGVRPVPVDDDLWPRLRAHVLTVKPGSCLADPPTGLLFTAPGGGVLHYSNWHDRIWQRALCEVTERGKRGKILATRKVLDDPQPTPHDLRHTYGTELANAGVPVHEIMKLMGHEKLESAQRYLHAGDDRFDRARKAIVQARVARS